MKTATTSEHPLCGTHTRTRTHTPQATALPDDQLSAEVLAALRSAAGPEAPVPEPSACSVSRWAAATERVRGARTHLGRGATLRDPLLMAAPLKGRLCFAGA